MRIQLFACLAVLAISAPALAHAADLQKGESRAVLASPAPKPVEAVIDGRIWHCQDTVCAARPNDSADSQRITKECHRAAVWLGHFTAYQTGAKTLTDVELVGCNAGVTTKEPRSPS
jgi:hypothetical protein